MASISPRSGAAVRLRRLCLVALAATALVTCTEEPTAPGRPGVGTVRVTPQFDAYARLVPLTLDNVRVIVVRPPSDVILTRTSPFDPSSQQLILSLPVLLQSSSEALQVTLELYAGSTLLFTGTSTVQVSAGATTTPTSVPVVYQGPGATVDSLTLAPRDTTVPLGASFPFRATAVDAQLVNVPQFYVSWTADNGTIDGAGVFTAPTVRDTLYVHGATPNGITDSTRVFVTAPPASLTKLSGDGQSGIVSTRLAQLLAVQVNGSDGLPVAGATVAFTVTSGGGSVDSATATSDAQGIARTGAVLGPVVSPPPQSFTATVSGIPAAVFTATATSSVVKVWTGAVDGNWATAGNWTPAQVPTTGDSVVIPTFIPNAPSLSGNATVGALVIRGTGSNLTVAGNLTVQRGVAIPDTNAFLDMSSGALAAGSVTLAGYQAFIDAPTAPVTVTGTTTISGNRAFVDARGNSNSFGAVIISGTQAFMQQGGGTSGSISLTSSALWEATGPVVVTGAPALSVQGTASLSTTGTGQAPVTFNGDVLLGGVDGRLIPNTPDAGFTINGNLSLSGAGRLEMLQSTDTVRVSGNATFGGADETGSLTAGALFIRGNFTQTGVATSFVGTGTHTVFLDGAAAQTVNFASPGFTASRFQNVIVANSAGAVTATSDVFASGTAGVVPGAPRVLSGNGSTLFTTILNVSNFTFNNLLLNFTGSTVATFDTVTFQGYAPTATPLTIVHPGAATPLPFQDIVFTVTPSTGFYIDATDSNPSDGVPLVIDMLNPAPASPAGRVQTAGATVNWASAGPIQWTGTVSTGWFTPGNWSTAAVPTIADDVVILSGTPNPPTISGGLAHARDLTVQAGAVLTVATNLQIGGSLDAAGTITGTVIGLDLTGTGTVRGNITGTFLTTIVNGTYTLNGRLVTPGLTINGSLTLAGNTAVVGSSVGEDFATLNNGVLVMTNALDSLIVGGNGPNALFRGGSTVGQLTAGVILMNSTGAGGFSQDNTFSDFSYAPSGTHKVVLANVSTTILAMDTPGAGSHFNILDISAQTGGITLQTTVQANGLLISTPVSTAPAINGGSNRLNAGGGTQITGLTLTNAPMVLSGGSSFQLDNVTFQSMPTSASQLSMGLPGSATPLTFNNLVFSAPPTIGFYVDAADSDNPSPDTLVVNLVNPTPATPGLFAKATNGAVINWPFAVPAKTWTGAVSTDWNNGSNWNPAVVPTATDTLVIPATANQPRLAQNVIIKNLTVQPGAAIDLNGFQAFLDGPAALPATPGFTGTGTIFATGATGTLQGNFGPTIPLVVQNPFTLAGRTVTGPLTVNGGGSLTILGQTLAAASLNIQNAGLVMGTAQDSVLVTGNSTFAGPANTALTAGTLVLSGDLTESGSFPAFDASGGHKTVLNGGALQTVTVFNGGFQDLDVSAAAGGVRIASSAILVQGAFTSTPSGAAPLFRSAGALLALRGPTQVTGLTLDTTTVSVFLPAGGPVQLDGLTFSNQQSFATALEIIHPGLAAPITVTNLTFTGSVPSLYLRASDFDGGPPDTLVIDVVNPTPATDGGLTLAVNGAVINWPAVAPINAWTGTTSTDWNTGTNWSTGTVPAPTDNVVIQPSTPFAPSIFSNVTVNDLTIQAGATLTTNDISLAVNGKLDAPGLLAGCCGDAIDVGGGSLRGNFDGVVLIVRAGAVVTLNGATTLTNSGVQVNGELILGGNTLDLGQGALNITNGTGLLTMTNPADLVRANFAEFSGGDETGRLTAGEIQTQTHFQGNGGGSHHPASFFASGNHRVVLGGPSSSSMNFFNPTTSRFQELDVTGVSATLTLQSDATVAGQLISLPLSTPPTINTFVGATLSAGGADVTGLVLDGVPLVLTGGLISAFSNVTFQNQSPLGTHLTVNNVGAPSAFIFGNLNFTTGLSAGGFYLVANDLDGASPDALTIDVISSNPASGAGVSQANAPAIINWPAAGATITWSGSAGTDWFNAANWVGGVVPTSIDNVFISAAVNQPALTNNAGVNDLNMSAGTTLELGDFVLVLNGNVIVGGSIEDVTGTGNGGVTVTGIGTGLRGTMNTTVSVTGSPTMLSNVITGDLALSGSLTVGANFLGVQGLLTTFGSGGLLVMTHVSGQVQVSGDVFFNGGNTTGLLTGGTLTVGGDFIQVGTNNTLSFAPSGTHTTAFNSPTLQSVSFTSPGLGAAGSHFQNLDLSAAIGGVSLQDLTTFADLVVSTDPAAMLFGNDNQLLMRRAAISGLTVDNALLSLDEQGVAAAENLSNITFQNFPTVARTMLTILGPGGTVTARPAVNTSNMTFQSLPTGAGNFYVKLASFNAQAFTLTMTGSNQSPGQSGNGPALSDPANEATVNGATILWP